MRCLLAAIVLLGFGSSVVAAEVTVHLSDAQGRAVNDAIVTLTADTAPVAIPAPERPARYVIDQRNEAFVPYVQLLRPGDRVVFRNSDTTRHHVYSFAAIRSFEFVLRPGESSPELRMDAAGIAAVGCNIHDHMITYLFVSAVPAAMSSEAGDAVLGQLAPGRYTAHVWHPQLHPGHPELTRKVTIASDSDRVRLAFTLSLMPDPRMSMDREHLDY
jgi:plastocyanin